MIDWVLITLGVNMVFYHLSYNRSMIPWLTLFYGSGILTVILAGIFMLESTQ